MPTGVGHPRKLRWKCHRRVSRSPKEAGWSNNRGLGFPTALAQVGEEPVEVHDSITSSVLGKVGVVSWWTDQGLQTGDGGVNLSNVVRGELQR